MAAVGRHVDSMFCKKLCIVLFLSFLQTESLIPVDPCTRNDLKGRPVAIVAWILEKGVLLLLPEGV